MKSLPRSFFDRPVLEVGADLLGCRVRHGGVTVRITETEAYAGRVDPASRVLSRPTRHNAPVFGPAGHAFVYFTYGHHWMLCVVTGEPDVPEVVLLRAGEVVAGHDVAAERRAGVSERDWCRGPGRLTAALGVTGGLSGVDLCAPGSPVVVGGPLAREGRHGVRTGPRVGVSGPGGDGTSYPWRFWLDGEPTVSPYRPGRRRPGR
ncbi:DNA-3-methyladenine glycosylase [Terrabacter aerolatus]|uniref:Putative 3-methyladenine DNA glycosylase n=1 Tax=Terrabacter aerolatus TaxID=422442 RepID=A0A512CXN1_9MICO|nr:DNA-3-methyladenine glycosylase [Terrabacter aerolatus]GEO28979.1 putative 3-methyladenine DNA glycosylase [Terrabacter aerolatus]